MKPHRWLVSIGACILFMLTWVLVAQSAISFDKDTSDTISVGSESNEITDTHAFTSYLPFISAYGDSGSDLLKNGNFETPAPWPAQDGRYELRVAPDWRAWYLDQPPSYVTRPYNCDGTDSGCYWAVPEFVDVQKAAYAYRVHSGDQAQKYFTYGRMHEAGLMQRVTGITPGAQLRFSVYMEAWMCNDYVAACDGGRKSQNPTTMHLRVGIDPTGGTDPFGSTVVWSSEGDSFDHWTQFSVEAAAKGDAVTVFTHSRPEWVDYARMNNDVYVDDASLVVVP